MAHGLHTKARRDKVQARAAFDHIGMLQRILAECPEPKTEDED